MATDEKGLFICPYNNSHRMQWLKLPNHLVKCRRNNPVLASKIEICPFNYCHHVPKEELEEHFRNCQESSKFQDILYSADTESERPSLKPRQNVDTEFMHVTMEAIKDCLGDNMNKNPSSTSSSAGSTGDKPVDTLEEGREHLRYIANRKLFEKPLPLDSEEARVQNQRNQDDLDEWYAQ